MEQPYYRVVGQEKELFERAYKMSLPMMLKGPTGSGKTRFVEAMAHAVERPLVTVACNEDTSAADLLGRFIVKGGDTVWQDGPVTRALREGAILYLDEVAEAREDVIVVLHPLADHRRELYVDRLQEKLKAPEGFMLIVSFNPGYRSGYRELKPSLRQRFVGLSMNYPSVDIEAEIVAKESGVDMATAKKLAKLADKIRGLDELTLEETVSTRLLVQTAKLIADGMKARQACLAGLVCPLTDDSVMADALGDVIAFTF